MPRTCLEIVDRGEWPVLVAVVDDRRGGRRADSGERLQRRGIGSVQVDDSWRAGIGGGTGVQVPRLTSRRRGLTTCWHGDAIAVGEWRGKVEDIGVSAGQRPAGGGDGVGDPLARLQRIDTWGADRPGDMDHEWGD